LGEKPVLFFSPFPIVLYFVFFIPFCPACPFSPKVSVKLIFLSFFLISCLYGPEEFHHLNIKDTISNYLDPSSHPFFFSSSPPCLPLAYFFSSTVCGLSNLQRQYFLPDSCLMGDDFECETIPLAP